jgi:hypothetical protein
MPTKPALRGVRALTVVLLGSLLAVACGPTATSPTAAASAGPAGSRSSVPAATPALSANPVEPQLMPSPVGESGMVQQPDGSFLFTPVSARIRGGVLYAYVAYTHCGFTPTTFDFDGSFWRVANAGAAEPGAAANPPAGIGNPEDQGTVVLVSPTDAVFTSQSGILVPLVRVDGPQAGFPCD